MDKITFEQLPQAVSLLIEKVGQLADKVDEALGKATQQKGKRLLALDDVAALLGKSASTIYAMTSEKRIPYIEAGDGTAGCIAKEIFSFVSAVVPEQCARKWMIQSGAMEPSEFLQAVADMEGVRLRARLLALELAAMNAKYNVLDTIPWNRLN